MSEQSNEGFSLVEVIIAMFLLAVLALAVLPLAVAGTRLTASNRDLVEATGFANAQLAPITADFPNDPVSPTTCTDLQAAASTDVPDPGDSGLVADVAVGSCPASYPGTVTVTVTVRDGEETLVSIPTRVMVSSP